MTTRKRHRRAGLALLVAMSLISLTLGTGTLAFHVGSVVLELDENVTDDSGGDPPTDWAEIYNAGGTPNLPAGTLDWTGVIQDFLPGDNGPDVSYHEPSNKDDQAIDETGGGEVWGCTDAANPGDKIDIVNAQALAITGFGEDAGDLLTFFEVERHDNSGDAFIGIWIFQADVFCNEATGKFEGEKRTGDVLLLADFTGGGTDVSLRAFSYNASGTTAPGTFTQIGAGGDCDGSVDNNGGIPPGSNVDMCLQVNDVADVDVPWPMEDKTKPGPPTPDVGQRLEIAEFVEGGINLTDAFAAAGLTPPACFGSFMAETRSSSSLDATLKDFALGDLQTCDARVSIAPNDINGIGESHTFTVTTEQQTGGGFVPAPNANVDVTLTNTLGSNYVIDAAASTCDDGQPNADNVDAQGQCTIVFSSATAGTVIGNASATIDLGGGSIIIRDTDPATSTTSGPGGSGPANKVFLDGTLVWHKVDQDGAPLGGATFQVCRTHKLDTSTDPDSYVAEPGTDGVCSTVVDDTDGTGGAAGSGLDEDGAPGEFLLSDLILGSYKVKETAAPAGYHIINTNFVSAGSHTLADTSLEIVAPFVNQRAFRVIVVTCDDVTDTIVDGTVTFDANGDQGGAITKVTLTAAQLAALGTTEAAFCGTTNGATFGDLDPATYDVNVEVPDQPPLFP